MRHCLCKKYGIRGGLATFASIFICFCILISVFISFSIFLFISFTFYTESIFFFHFHLPSLRILISVFISVAIFPFSALRLRYVMPCACRFGFKSLFFFPFIIWHINFCFHFG